MDIIKISNEEFTKKEVMAFLTDWQKFQSELKTFKKENKVDFENKKTLMRTKYAYITIDEIFEHLRGMLDKYNLSFFQDAECREETTEVKANTYICHSKSGIIIKLKGVWVPGGNDAQKMGSGLTYASRYAFVRAFGIGASDDDDALSISNENAQPKAKARANKPLHQQKDFMAQQEEKQKSEKDLQMEQIMADPNLLDIFNGIKVCKTIEQANELLPRVHFSGNAFLMNGFVKILDKNGMAINGTNIVMKQ